MMSEIQNHNEVLCFYDMLQKYNVEIPIIQRDYAQGRIGNQQILRNFLDALKISIAEDSPINLDFVYGNVFGDVFQPLDGQQRLTTLYLLHWYAFAVQKLDDSSAVSVLLKFTYETRISSREFCKALITNDISIESSKQRISDVLTDSKWFFMSWGQDPTIRSMLNTIDQIHKVFHDVENLWYLLTNKKIITFYLLT